MGKAFQCDNCLECFPGGTPYIIGEKELCGGCKRALEALSCVDWLEHMDTYTCDSYDERPSMIYFELGGGFNA